MASLASLWSGSPALAGASRPGRIIGKLKRLIGPAAFVVAPRVVPPASCRLSLGHLAPAIPRSAGDALGTAAGIFWRVTPGKVTH